MAGPIRISILANASQARREFGTASSSADRFGRSVRTVGRSAAIGFGALGAAAAAGAAATAYWVGKGAVSLARIERIGAQTDAAIQSTGGTANITRAKIDELAGSLEALTGTEAESITEGANFLLTFTNIRNAVGKNNDIFNQTVGVLTDMSRAMDNTGGSILDTRKTALQLGKALNDPVKGITALSRVGVSFTEQQKKQIEALVEGGNTMKAQKVILAELNKEFGGSAEAFGATTAGKVERFKHEVGTLQETLADALSPTVEDLTNYLIRSGIPTLQRWGESYNRDAVPAIHAAIDSVKEFYGIVREDGLDGVIHEVEELTGTQGQLRPVVDEVRDAFDGLQRILAVTGPAFADALGGISPLLSPLNLVGEALGAVGTVLEALPDGLVTLGIQVAILSRALPILQGAVTRTGTAFTTATQRATAFGYALRSTSNAGHAAAITKIGNAAKGAAGIGGMLALSSAAGQADGAMRTLTNVGGGALLGFSLGGPIGAAIGAGAGALIGLAGAGDDAGDAMVKAERPAADYAATLDDLTGSLTRATRAEIFKQFTETGAISQARQLGIASRDVVGAVLGEEGALRRVQAGLRNAESFTVAYRDAQGALNVTALDSQKQVDRFTRTLVANGGTIDDVTKRQIDLASQSGLTDFIQTQTDSWRASSKAKRQEILATQDLSGVLRKVPRRVASQIEATGVVPTIRGVARVVSQYDLADRRQIESLLEVTGVDASIKGIRTVAAGLEDVEQIRPRVTGLEEGVEEGTRRARSAAESGSRAVADAAERPIRDARADLGPFGASVSVGILGVRGRASTGGREVGAALKSGIILGFSGTAAALASQAGSAVSAAIAEARSRARVNSPSKETYYIGQMLGDGLVAGMAAKVTSAKKAGRDLIAAALGATGSGQGVLTGLGNVSEVVERTYAQRTARAERDAERRTRAAEKGAADELRAEQKRLRERLKGDKLEKALREAERDSERDLQARLKSIRTSSRERLAQIAEESKAARKLIKQEDDRLRENAKRQDAVAQRLTAATGKLKQLRQEAAQYASSIQQLFVSYGSVVGLGTLGDGQAITSDRIVSQLQARLTAARDYSATIQRLRRQGLNGQTVQQLLDAGVEGGSATAAAIAAGGKSSIQEINSLTKDLAAAGGGLGSAMVKEFKQAGIDAAAGLVQGLQSRGRELDKVAERLADTLVNKIKNQLGIKSPSKVFARIGDDTVKGLTGSLKANETYVKRQAASLGYAMETGFRTARPTLDTSVTGGGTSQPQTVVVTLRADQVSAMQQGKDIQMKLDIYHANGGTSKVVRVR